MWRNTVMEEFVEGLRRHNAAIPADDRGRAGVGFYGMCAAARPSASASRLQGCTQNPFPGQAGVPAGEVAP
jgi:erythromycin esterase-like protein